MKPLLSKFVFLVAMILFFDSYAFTIGPCNSPLGKIRVTIFVDGVEREFFIHVPATYDGNSAVPLVFMLHGTGGDGEAFYDSHGWKELSEKENFIVVFPSSMRYKIIDDGENKIITKWNHTPDANWIFQPGEKGQDDIKFLRKIIDEMKTKYNINSNRIYLNGFSNGGSMAAKCSVEMSDVLAAVAGNAASFFKDTIYIPKRKLPVLFQVGNRDYGPGNIGPEVSMIYFDTLLKSENISLLNGKHHRIAQRHIDNFDLQSSYTIEGDTNFALVATYLPNNPGPNTGYEFKFVFVKGLGHAYPNGNNHPFDSPARHWEWMKQYTLDEQSNTLMHLKLNDGYGSGDYAVGDTVHIWAAEPESNRTFKEWIGDKEFLEVDNNWHTTLVMPNHDVELSASYINLPAGLEYKEELIQGKLSKKSVFSYFPHKEKMKGVVWLFQGSNIKGEAWLSNTDMRHFVDMLVANDYGVITMDAEEVTQQIDFDNNGVFEYQYEFDTVNNPDLANVKLVRQFFLSKDFFTTSTPMFATGFSSGGAFAELLAGIYGWKASLSYNTTGSDFMSQKSNVPHYQNNSQRDNEPSVGLAGNISAYEDYQLYISRNVPTQWILQRPQPLHPERFDRIEGVSLAQSTSIYNAIDKQGMLDVKNYLNVNPAKLKAEFEINPEKFPALQALPLSLVEEIFGQLNVVYTNHTFRADYNGSALTFLTRFSDISTVIKEEQSVGSTKVIFMPNPATNHITFGKSTSWSIIDLNGCCLIKGISADAFIGDLQNGMYIVKTEWGSGMLVKM